MTNELEKQFFDTFGIKQKLPCDTSCYIDDGVYCYGCTKGYPQITERILLELICIDNQENVYKCRPLMNNVEELKNYILEEFIRLKEIGLLKREKDIQNLFKES